MGEAKRRGSQADRISQAHARLDALRPEKLVCGACQTAFTEFEGMEPRDMPGIRAIFGGECPNCGESVISFNGEPAVSYTHLTLPTIQHWCRSRWSPYH